MKRTGLTRSVAVLALVVAATPALAQTGTADHAGSTAARKHAAHPAKSARTTKARPQAAPAPAQGGLNAPSMNFSGVTPETDDPSAGAGTSGAGPRPMINGSGGAGMNFGF